MNLAFGLLFSEGDRNHILGGNIEKCVIDVDLRPSRRGTENKFSLFYRLQGQVHWRGLSVGVNHEKPILSQRHAQARFGGPCRERTYGPLIKSGRRPMIRTALCCEGFPVLKVAKRLFGSLT